MDQPACPTPTPTAPPLRLFLDSTGSQLPVIVEPNGVKESVPKLIRLLRRHGAMLCHDPALARIILVDPQTSEGRKSIRDWGKDPAKVVLDFSWARKCVGEGRALLENDNWGGCGDLEDTYESDDQDNDTKDEAIRSLPTPRPTPIEGPPSHKKRESPVVENGISSQPTLPPARTSLYTEATRSLTQAEAYPSNTPPSSAMSQTSPLPLVPANVIPTQMDASMFSNPVFLQAMNMFMGMSQNGVLPWTNPSMFNSPALPFIPMAMPLNSMPFIQSAQTSQFPLPPSEPFEPLHDHRPSLRDQKRDSEGPSEDENELMYPETPVASTSKSRGKASRGNKSHTAASPAPKRRKMYCSPRPVQPLTPEQSSQSSVSSDDRLSSLFLSNDGTSMLFFVQVDLRNRMSILQMIRKHGGKITPAIPEADFVILSTQGTSFGKLLQETTTTGKIALRANFVQSCVEASTIVDECNFVIEPPPSAAKVKGSRPRARTKPEDRASSCPKPQKKHIKLEPKGDNMGINRSPSPIPPAAVPWVQGRNRFTTEDHTFVLNFCRRAFRQDPHVTTNSLSIQLAKKAPSHPQQSWLTYLNKHRDKLDAIRGEVVEKPASPINMSNDDQDDDDIGRRGGESADEDCTMVTNVAWDLDTITAFFSALPEGSDQELWLSLAREHKCRTAASWETFYASRKDEVDEVVENAIRENEARERANAHAEGRHVTPPTWIKTDLDPDDLLLSGTG